MRAQAAIALLIFAAGIGMPLRKAAAQAPLVPPNPRAAPPFAKPTVPPQPAVPAQAPAPGAQSVPQTPAARSGQAQPGAPAPSTAISRWFNPATAPFLPVPMIAVDPDSGTTLGIIPTWLKTDEHHEIHQIIAPDIMHNPYFGWGVHGRIYDYPTADEQWSLTAGIKQRVERGVNAEYQLGRLHNRRWSLDFSLIYDRDGTQRFYGIGNHSPEIDQTNFTDEQALAQAQAGFNFTPAWQLQYTLRVRAVDVERGTLAPIPSTNVLFPKLRGLNTTQERLNRLAVIYDTRDDVTVPTRGMEWVFYGGMASRSGIFNESLYSETGLDGRGFWAITQNTILAAHVALRYMPQAARAPFWALSTLGGGQSVIGGAQPLRGFGAGRFYDRDSFATSIEVRRRVGSLRIASTRLELEVAPFLDMGRVFSQLGTWPVGDLHKVVGVGFRGVARPFVVGYVDVGYGSEGAAVFTGIGYPF